MLGTWDKTHWSFSCFTKVHQQSTVALQRETIGLVFESLPLGSVVILF
jgi:hypothetical protein